MIDVAKLRELLQAVRQVKWTPDIGVYEDPDGDPDLAFARGPMIERKLCESYEALKQRAYSSALLACAAVNALPELLDEVEQLRSAVRTEGSQYVVESGKFAAQGVTPQEAIDALTTVAYASGLGSLLAVYEAACAWRDNRELTSDLKAAVDAARKAGT